MKERTISNKMLIYKVLKSWRAILISIIIGMVLVNGLLALNTSQKIKEAKAELAALESVEEEENSTGVVLPDSSLSTRVITETQVAVEVYKSLRKDYLQTLQYIQNSLYMQINPNSVSRYRLQYLLDNHFEVKYPIINKKDTTNDILQSYMLRLTNNEVCEEIADTLGYETETSYIRELISVYSSEDILNISVIGKDQESCMKIAEILKKELDKSLVEFRKIYGQFDFTLINEEYYISADSDIFSKQLAQFTHLTSTKNTFNGLPAQMTDKQKTYYYELLDSLFENTSDAEESIEMTADAALEGEDVIVIPTMQWYSIKGTLIGFVLGLFLACGWVILKTLLSGSMQSEEDVRGTAPVLGTLIREPEKRKLGGIDQWLFKKLYRRELMASEEERFDMITTGIRLAAERLEGKKIFVTGTDMEESAQKLQQRLVNDLKGSLDISCGRSALMDPMSLKTMSEADGVVLVETLEESRYEEVKRQWNLCEQSETPVLGYVIVK